jgi:hypothetical protein
MWELNNARKLSKIAETGNPKEVNITCFAENVKLQNIIQ